MTRYFWIFALCAPLFIAHAAGAQDMSPPEQSLPSNALLRGDAPAADAAPAPETEQGPAATEPVTSSVPPAEIKVNPALHPELQKFQKDGGRVTFIGHAYGVDGYLVEKDENAPRAVYITPEGGMLIGMLVGPDGRLETQAQLLALQARATGSQDALPGADKALASKPEKFYAEAGKLNMVKAGKDGAPYVYIFMNVTCDHCQEYWKDLRPAIKAGKLQVRLIPYGSQQENAEGGAALLSVNDAAAWDAFIGGDKTALGKDKIAAGAIQKIRENTEMLRRWKVGAVPFTIYRRLSDGQLAVINGRPGNLMMMLADLVKQEAPEK